MNMDTALFNIFQPICIKLTESVNYENVHTLHRALQFVDTTIPDPLQEYILFPLRMLLFKSESSTNMLHEVISCISLTLEKSKSMRSFSTFKDLLFQITILLTDRKDVGSVVNASEELKLAYMNCLTLVIRKADSSILEQLYTERFLPQLAHMTMLLLNLSCNEAARHVRISAMKLLRDFSGHDKNSDIQQQSATVFASFIPKISIDLLKVALGDTVQGHLVTLTALETWTHLVVLTMKDKHLNGLNETPDDASDNMPANHPRLVDRNETWVKVTSANLCTLIERLSELVSHSHWKVRLATAEWAGRLLFECSKSLEPSRGKLLEVILTLVADDMNKVSERSSELLRKSSSTFTSSDSFIEMIEDNLFELVTKLPRILRNADDAKKLSQLHLLAGYLKLLGSKIQHLLHSNSHMHRLSQALLQLSEMDCSSIHIVALKTTSVDYSGNFEESKLSPIKKTFRHFTDENITLSLIEICHLLGKQGELDYLIDHFTEVIDSSQVHHKEAVFILNELVLGNSATHSSPFNFPDLNVDNVLDNTKNLPALINCLLDVYLQPSIWLLPITIEAIKSDTSKPSNALLTKKQFEVDNAFGVEKLNDNIILTCILLEGLNNFSEVLGIDFIPFLRKVLYPLLDKMGSSSAMVSHTATYVAMGIASNTGYKTVANMIHANADYLVDQLSVKLRFVLQYPDAPQILRVAVQNSGHEILPLLKDCIDELLCGLDVYHSQKTELFTEAIYALVFQVEKWFSKDLNSSSTEPDSASKESESLERDKFEHQNISFESIRDYFIRYHQLKEAASGNVEDLDDVNPPSEIDTECDNAEETKKESPYHILLVTKLLEKCVHLISNKKLPLSVLILDTIDVGIKALRHSEDDLLPMIHKLWQPLVARFSDPNLVIVKKVFLIICTMANLSKQFISRKVLTDIWKKITSFLNKQAEISRGKDTQAYHFTAAFKLQHAMITNISVLTKQLDLTVEHHDGLIRCCLPYLNRQQPQDLQNAALDAFKIIYSFEPDLVWLHLFQHSDRKNLSTPNSSFKPVQLFHHVDVDTEENIARLIPLLEL